MNMPVALTSTALDIPVVSSRYAGIRIIASDWNGIAS